MILFTNEQVYMANKIPAKRLRKEYKKSERDLRKYATLGDKKNFSMVMKKHSDIEYAMLFQKTPNFRKGRF